MSMLEGTKMWHMAQAGVHQKEYSRVLHYNLIELIGFSLNMLDGKGSDVEMESENEEDGIVLYKQKYWQLKSRLKYTWST